jgi:hypothetical protein
MAITDSVASVGAKYSAASGKSGNEPVRAHLQHHACQDHRAGRRRLDVGVGQPGVEREERHLDRKRQREGKEEPVLRVLGNLQLIQLEQVEAVTAGRPLVQPRQPDDRDQHQHAAGHRVEDELHRRVDAAVVAPHADEEIHRDEDEVPEHVEQEDIERREDAEHRRLEEQHEDREFLDLLVNALPSREERDRRQEPGEHDQHQADAVDAQVVLDAERRNPRPAFDELELAGLAGGVEAGPERQRRQERHH